MSCTHTLEANVGRLFCQSCGKLLDRDGLKNVRLAGAVGVRHTSNPEIERFWRTGDPTRL